MLEQAPSDDLLSQMEEDTPGSYPVPSNADLAQVSSLVNLQKKLESEVALYEQMVDEAKKKLAEVREKFLPEALAKFGLLELTMIDGSKVTIKPETFASIPKKVEKEAYEWLKSNGFGNLIKEEISVPLPRGENDGKLISEFLELNGFSYEMDQSIHYQTLRAWAREQLELGAVPPQELFSIFVKKVAKIK